MLKLTEEQHDSLRELVDTEGYSLLVKVILPQLVNRLEAKVLSVSSEQPTLLQLEKARLEGAKSLQNFVADLKKTKRGLA